MRTSFIITFLLAALSALGQGTLKFERVGNMPFGVSSFGYAQSEDEIYVIGGVQVQSLIQLYNAKLDQWLELPIKQISSVQGQSAVYLKEYRGLVLAGGIKPHKGELVLMDDIRIVYGEEFKLDSLGKLPFPARFLGMAAHEKRVFMFGGSTSIKYDRSKREETFSNKLYVYNLENGYIEILPDLPVAMNTQGGIMGRYLYLLGGYNGKSQKSVWRFDILDQTWEALKPLPKPASRFALVQYKHYFILLGGYHNENRIMVYDTETEESYRFKTNLSGKFQGASILQNELHVYGGVKQGFNGYNGHHKLSIHTLMNALARTRQ